METETLTLDTGRTRAVVDITSAVRRFTAGRGDGLVSVFAPHATAGLAIIETGAGSDQDLLDHLQTVFPPDDRWRHRHGSAGHGADHVIPGVISPSLTVPVVGGTPALGTWQSIVLVDVNRDNPARRVMLSFIAG